MKKYKKALVISLILTFILMLTSIGSSYAYFSYTKKGTIKNILETGVHGPLLKDIILENNTLITSAPTLTTSANNTSDPSGLYQSTATNDGNPTYYFRGNVTNNYVNFAGFTWRIVRINEDGSIRMIMTEGINDGQLAIFAGGVQSSIIDFMYYSYGSNASTLLNTWYSTHLSTYDNKIVTGEYCEQAKVIISSSYNSGNATTVYRTAYKNPDFKCVTDDGNGYGIVNAKIGLITVEEFMYTGGGIWKQNTSHYLDNGTSYWTMSPAGFNKTNSYVWKASTANGITYSYINVWAHTAQFRPVINLKADTIATGSGIIGDEYIVQ